MTPYRTIGENRTPRPDRTGSPDDDHIILWVLLVVALLGLVPRIFSPGKWGAEPTLALLIAATSAWLLFRRWRGRRRRKRGAEDA